jgi:hypothetical protein
MKANQKCIISKNAPFHAGRTGFYRFSGNGGTIVLSETKDAAPDGSRVMFAVDLKDIETIEHG